MFYYESPASFRCRFNFTNSAFERPFQGFRYINTISTVYHEHGVSFFNPQFIMNSLFVIGIVERYRSGANVRPARNLV